MSIREGVGVGGMIDISVSKEVQQQIPQCTLKPSEDRDTNEDDDDRDLGKSLSYTSMS